MNGCAPGLALIERFKATRKWAIPLVYLKTNSVIWLAESLHLSHIISVQWLGVVDKIAVFPRFSKVLKKHLETNG